jgi:hypothetical protein
VTRRLAAAQLPVAIGQARSRTVPRLENRLFIACGLAWGSGLIHVDAAVQHVDEYVLFAVFFVVLALLQLAWGIAVCLRPSPALLRAGAVGSLLVALLWVASRTTGLPLGPERWEPESVGAFDSIATADEVVLALLVFLPAGLSARGILHRGSRQAAAAVGLLLILVSSLALVGGGHAH